MLQSRRFRGYHRKLDYKKTGDSDSLVRHECEQVDIFITCIRMKSSTNPAQNRRLVYEEISDSSSGGCVLIQKKIPR
jgi:hypothetical protein